MEEIVMFIVSMAVNLSLLSIGFLFGKNRENKKHHAEMQKAFIAGCDVYRRVATLRLNESLAFSHALNIEFDKNKIMSGTLAQLEEKIASREAHRHKVRGAAGKFAP